MKKNWKWIVALMVLVAAVAAILWPGSKKAVDDALRHQATEAVKAVTKTADGDATENGQWADGDSDEKVGTGQKESMPAETATETANIDNGVAKCDCRCGADCVAEKKTELLNSAAIAGLVAKGILTDGDVIAAAQQICVCCKK